MSRNAGAKVERAWTVAFHVEHGSVGNNWLGRVLAARCSLREDDTR